MVRWASLFRIQRLSFSESQHPEALKKMRPGAPAAPTLLLPSQQTPARACSPDKDRPETPSQELHDKLKFLSGSAPESSALEETVHSLMDLGFTDDQVIRLCEGAYSQTAPLKTQGLATLSTITTLGLNTGSILRVPEKCPELSRVNGNQLQQRIDSLRKLGLLEV